MGLLNRILGAFKGDAEPAQRRDQAPAVPQHQQPARDAAAASDFQGGQAATRPESQGSGGFGGGPIPGEEAWLQEALKYNRRQGYTPKQWKAMQAALGISVDGIPGREVARAVYRFQQSKGLELDGQLGPNTQSQLKPDAPPAHDPDQAPDSAPIPEPETQSHPAEQQQEVEQTQTTPAAQTSTQDAQSDTAAAQSDTDTAATQGETSLTANADGEKRTPTFATDRTRYMAIADQVTSVMEASTTQGDYGLLHTLADGGGISYGKHQVTLTSGTLHKVLVAYLDIAEPDSPNAKVLKNYVSRAKAIDMSLVGDQTFLNTLRAAASEDAMKKAQDAVFTEGYGKKAWAAAASNEIASPLGHAMLYDTKIQGGMETLLSRTRKKLGGDIGDTVEGAEITERKFLMTFNDLREARLEALAVKAENQGKAKRGEMLRNSKYRCRAFRELLVANNLNVAGPGGEVRIKGPGGARYTVEGFDNEEVRGSDTAEMLAKLPVIGKATITAGKLNVRFGPSSDTARIDAVREGDVLDVFATEGEWLKVRVGEVIGYIHGDYTDFQGQHPDQQGP